MLRRVGEPTCTRCHQTVPIRPLAIGMVTPGRRNTPLLTPEQATPHEGCEAMPEGKTLDRTDMVKGPEIPDRWSERLLSMPPNTLIHIPVSIRLRMAKEAEDVFNGMANLVPEWALAGEGFFKLLLGNIP